MSKETEASAQNTATIFPEHLLDYILETNGIDLSQSPSASHTNSIKKTIAAITQKIITDVTKSCDHFHKLNRKREMRDKRFSRVKRKCLGVNDVLGALEEIGIDIEKPDFYL